MIVLMFGDSEPEDAWTAGDPINVLIDNLERRLIRLDPDADLDPAADDVLVRLDYLERALGRVRGRVEVDEDWRVDLIGRHIQVVLERIGRGDD